MRKLSFSFDIYYSLKIRSFTSVLLVHSFIKLASFFFFLSIHLLIIKFYQNMLIESFFE